MGVNFVTLDVLGSAPVSRGPVSRCLLLLRQGYLVNTRPAVARMVELGFILEPGPERWQGSRCRAELTKLGRAVAREYAQRYPRGR